MLKFKSDADVAIYSSIAFANTKVDGTPVDGLTQILKTAVDGMSGIPTIAGSLADSKVIAKNILNAVYMTYDSEDYSAANWSTLTGFKNNGDTAVNNATSLAAIATAQKNAINGMTAVTTISGSLIDGKVSANNVVSAIFDTYSGANYTPVTERQITGLASGTYLIRNAQKTI